MIRLYTEDVNRDAIVRILDAHFDGYTLIPALGRWKGQSEASLVIELLNVPYQDARKAAYEIMTANKQEAVIVQVLSDASHIIVSPENETIIPRILAPGA